MSPWSALHLDSHALVSQVQLFHTEFCRLGVEIRCLDLDGQGAPELPSHDSLIGASGVRAVRGVGGVVQRYFDVTATTVQTLTGGFGEPLPQGQIPDHPAFQNHRTERHGAGSLGGAEVATAFLDHLRLHGRLEAGALGESGVRNLGRCLLASIKNGCWVLEGQAEPEDLERRWGLNEGGHAAAVTGSSREICPLSSIARVTVTRSIGAEAVKDTSTRKRPFSRSSSVIVLRSQRTAYASADVAPVSTPISHSVSSNPSINRRISSHRGSPDGSHTSVSPRRRAQRISRDTRRWTAAGRYVSFSAGVLSDNSLSPLGVQPRVEIRSGNTVRPRSRSSFIAKSARDNRGTRSVTSSRREPAAVRYAPLSNVTRAMTPASMPSGGSMPSGSRAAPGVTAHGYASCTNEDPIPVGCLPPSSDVLRNSRTRKRGIAWSWGSSRDGSGTAANSCTSRSVVFNRRAMPLMTPAQSAYSAAPIRATPT